MSIEPGLRRSRNSLLRLQIILSCFLIGMTGGAECAMPGLQQMNQEMPAAQFFPIDITLGRDGPLFVNLSECPPQANVSTGSGFAESVTMAEASPPSIRLTVRAPKGTDSTATAGSCGLFARYVMLPADDGATSRTGELSGTIQITAVQNGSSAKNYNFFADFDLSRVNTDTPDIRSSLGIFQKEYCLLETFCNEPLPDDSGGGVGAESLSFSFPNITFESGTEYIISTGIRGSLSSSQGIPDIGGDIQILLEVVDVQLFFQD